LETEIAAAVAAAQAALVAAKAPDVIAPSQPPTQPKTTKIVKTRPPVVDPPTKAVAPARDKVVKPFVKPAKKLPPKRRQSYDALCRRALDKVLAGDATGGHRLYERAIKLNPKRVEAYKKLCASLRNSGSRKALKYCQEWARRETNPIRRAKAKKTIERIKAKLE
jgi:hypothetical protein